MVTSAPERMTSILPGVPSLAVNKLDANWMADSSSTMVTVADDGLPRAPPPCTLLSVTVNVSSPSAMVSWKIGITTVLVVSPTPKVTMVETLP